MALRVTKEDRLDLHVAFVAFVVASIATLFMALGFLLLFTTPKALGVCARYDWNEEGTMPLTHQHCVEKTYPFTMHNPPEIKL